MSLLTRMLQRWRQRSRWRVTGTVIATLSVAAALLSAATVSAGSAAAASCGTTNLALHQPTTASSVQGPSWPASNATDGNLTTRWSSAFSDPQWLEVDLGSTQPICQVVIHWETAYAKAFQIQTSNDNTTWTTIYSTTTGTGGTQTLNVSGSGRYIRMYGTIRATQYGYSIYEFQVYAATGTGNTVTVTNPGAQTSKVGTAASLQIQASDSASGQTLTYSAAGLPAGLSVNSSTGLISGTPTTAGTSTVTVTAKDTTGASGSASFSWTVNPAWRQHGDGDQPRQPDLDRGHRGQPADPGQRLGLGADTDLLRHRAAGRAVHQPLRTDHRHPHHREHRPPPRSPRRTPPEPPARPRSAGPSTPRAAGEPPASFWGNTSAIPAATTCLRSPS